MTKTNPADLELVRELASILDETKLTEIEVERGNLRVRITRQTVMNVTAAPAMVPAQTPDPSSLPSQDQPPSEQEQDMADAITSPMVGTVYLQASPDDPPFIKQGDEVKEGDTLLLIEAMKTFNPIPAPKSGKVHKILVKDAEPVDYGAPLVVIV